MLSDINARRILVCTKGVFSLMEKGNEGIRKDENFYSHNLVPASFILWLCSTCRKISLLQIGRKLSSWIGVKKVGKGLPNESFPSCPGKIIHYREQGEMVENICYTSFFPSKRTHLRVNCFTFTNCNFANVCFAMFYESCLWSKIASSNQFHIHINFMSIVSGLGMKC